MKEYEFHPLANAFPLMSDPDLDKLGEDIRANGQILPIYLLDGKILDGRNRYMACLRNDIEPLVNHVDIDVPDPVKFVSSLNLHRRHMSPDKRAEVIVELRQQGLSYRQIGAAVGVSHTEAANTVKRVYSEQPEVITGKDGRKQPSTRKHTARDSHSETTEESLEVPTLDDAKQVFRDEGFRSLDESTGELTEDETSEAIVESFCIKIGEWATRIRNTNLNSGQVARCKIAADILLKELV